LFPFPHFSLLGFPPFRGFVVARDPFEGFPPLFLGDKKNTSFYRPPFPPPPFPRFPLLKGVPGGPPVYPPVRCLVFFRGRFPPLDFFPGGELGGQLSLCFFPQGSLGGPFLGIPFLGGPPPTKNKKNQNRPGGVPFWGDNRVRVLNLKRVLQKCGSFMFFFPQKKPEKTLAPFGGFTTLGQYKGVSFFGFFVGCGESFLLFTWVMDLVFFYTGLGFFVSELSWKGFEGEASLRGTPV